MAVPVHLDCFVKLHALNHLFDVADQRLHAFGRRVADRVADADAPRPGFNRRAVERANRFRMRPRRVFSDVHYRKPMRDSKRHGFFGRRQHHLKRPAFGVLPDGA